MNNPIEEFKKDVENIIEEQGNDEEFLRLTDEWMVKSIDHRSSYVYRWMGRPIIQYPQDMVQMQELIWEIRPDLIIETGIAHGGSLIFYASMLKLLGEDKKRRVLGIDIDIREHNRKEIEKHPMYSMISMIQGSSIDDEIVEKVHEFAKGYEKIIVVLDSCHTYDHVIEECRKYSDLVTKGSYLCVFDTMTGLYYRSKKEKGEELPKELVRPWNENNNAQMAAEKFAKENNRFEVDTRITRKLLISCASGGYLKCVK